MCGISAIVSLDRSKITEGIPKDESVHVNGSNRSDELVRQMQESLDLIKHRGPDSSGIWISDADDIGLHAFTTLMQPFGAFAMSVANKCCDISTRSQSSCYQRS